MLQERWVVGFRLHVIVGLSDVLSMLMLNKNKRILRAEDLSHLNNDTMVRYW